MVDTIIDNYTLRTQRKVEIRLEIDLMASAAQLEALTPAVNTLLEKPEIENKIVGLSDTGKTAHIFSIDYFVTMSITYEEFVKLREKVNLDLIGLLEEMNIGLAANSTHVVVDQINK